jgi:hypothetical protein
VSDEPRRLVWSGVFETLGDALAEVEAQGAGVVNLFGVSAWLDRQGSLCDRIDPSPASIAEAALPRPSGLPPVVAGGVTGLPAWWILAEARGGSTRPVRG